MNRALSSGDSSAPPSRKSRSSFSTTLRCARVSRSNSGACLERLEFLEQSLVLRELGVVLRHLRQVRVVRFPQLRAVHHGIQVPDHPPGPAETLVRILQRLHEIVPGGGHRGSRNALDQRAVFREQLIHRRRHELRLEFGKARQPGEIEEGVHIGSFKFQVSSLKLNSDNSYTAMSGSGFAR